VVETGGLENRFTRKVAWSKLSGLFHAPFTGSTQLQALDGRNRGEGLPS